MITDLTSDVMEKVKSECVPMVKKALGDDLCDIIMYGSCARDDFNEDSDIDIALLQAFIKSHLKPCPVYGHGERRQGG